MGFLTVEVLSATQLYAGRRVREWQTTLCVFYHNLKRHREFTMRNEKEKE